MRGLRANARLAVSVTLVTLAMTQCRTTDKGSSGLQSVVVEGEAESGFTTYFVEGDEVLRYRCPAVVLESATDQTPVGDPKFVKAKCQQAPSATGNKVTLKTFETKLKSVYLQVVDDQQLTVQEEDVLDFLFQSVKAPAGSKPPLVLSPHEQPAMDRIQARFGGLFDTAYDFDNGTPEATTVTDSKAATSGGLNLAAGAPVDLAQLKFKSTFSGVAPFNLSMNVSSGLPAVSTLFVNIQKDPSGDCRTRVVGIAAVAANTPSGVKPVSVVPHPVKANAWMINFGTDVAVSKITVTVKKPPLTVSQNCILTVRGQGVADQPPPPPPLQNRDVRMKNIMATRSHRMWHYLWHGIRNAWPRMTAEDRQSVRQVLGPAWGRKDSESVQNPEPAKGEEFLHMHRGMIQVVKETLGPDMYDRWREPPAPNDPNFPLPGGNTVQSNQEYQQLKTWNGQAIDQNRLRTMTLGQYGEFIELTLHNTMHMRFADEARANADVMAGGLFSNPKPEWDDPSNDYLGSTYSSHVNPIFWRLHGYVDDRINDWLKANGFTSIADNCGGASSCYQWRGVWDGPMPSHPTVAVAAAAAVGLPKGVGATPESAEVSAHGQGGGFDPDLFRQLPKTLARLIDDNSVMFPVIPP